MPTALFSGSIRPEWLGIEIEVSDPPLRARLSDGAGGPATIAFLIGQSQLSFLVSTEREVEDVGSFRNEIFSAIRPLFDLLGYLHGQVVQFEIPSVTFIEQQRISIFLEAVPGIFDQPQERPLGVDQLFPLAISNRHFGRALSDLRGAIEMFNDTAFHAFRAVEDVMQFFADSDTERSAAWQRMRDTLGVSRDFLRPLEEESKLARHGNPRFLLGAERIDLMLRAWRVVDRFTVFLFRGASAALPSGEYPLLH